jgi:DNA-binding MarR family transcriptional regulator
MKKVIAMDLEGNELGEYHSINEAARAMKVAPETVHKHVKGLLKKDRKSRIPYDFKYKEIDVEDGQ